MKLAKLCLKTALGSLFRNTLFRKLPECYCSEDQSEITLIICIVRIYMVIVKNPQNL